MRAYISIMHVTTVKIRCVRGENMNTKLFFIGVIVAMICIVVINIIIQTIY